MTGASHGDRALDSPGKRCRRLAGGESRDLSPGLTRPEDLPF